MIVLSKKLTMQEVAEINDFPNGFVKGVVDIEQEIVALDADWHYQLSDFLKSQNCSKEIDMWGLTFILMCRVKMSWNLIRLSIYTIINCMDFCAGEWT